MIANITSGNSFKGLVMYNEKKVMSKKAIRIYGNIASIESTPSQLITLLEDVSNQNNKVAIKTFHVSLAFAQLDKIDGDVLKDIGNEYMEKMGYGSSPYMIYSHFDTGIDHMHILSTRINMEGRKVNDTYEKYKSQRITRELEIKYNLQIVPSLKGKTKKDDLTFNLDGSINTKHLLEVAIDDVLNNLKATSMEHFVKILAEKRVIVDFQREDKKGNVLPMPGILFSMGYKNTPDTKRIKGSLFHKNYTYKNIINILNQNLLKEQSKVEKGRTKEELKKVIRILIPKIQEPAIANTSDLDLLLKVNKLKAIYLSNSGGIYGLKILDLTSNLEYKASDIDRDFSWNAVKNYLSNSEVRKPKERRQENSFIVNKQINGKGINQLPLSPIDRRFVNAIYKNDQSALKELIKYGDRIKLNDIELSNAAKEGVKTYKQLVNTQSKVSKTFKFAAYCASVKQSEINYGSKSKKIGFDEYILALNKRGIGVSFDVDGHNLVKNIVYHDKNKTVVMLPADMAPFLSELTLSKFVDFSILENFKRDIDNNNGFIKIYTDDQIDFVNAIENNNDYLETILIGKGTVVKFTDEEISYFEIEDDYFEEETIEESEMPSEFKKVFIELMEGLMQTTQGENPRNRNDDKRNNKKKRRGLRI